MVNSKLTLNDYLDTFLLDILKKGETVTEYVFLDEIQYIEKWQPILERYYDNESSINLILVDHLRSFLKKTTESLAGSIYLFKLRPLGFEEFLELVNTEKNCFLPARNMPFLLDKKSFLSIKKLMIFFAKNGAKLEKKKLTKNLIPLCLFPNSSVSLIRN